MSTTLFQILFYSVRCFFPRLWHLDVDTVLAQAMHETGNFTSDIFKENKNLFGMKLAKVRPTLAIGENRNHAVFPNYFAAMRDYFMWAEYFKLFDTAAYRKFLTTTYATDKQYILKLDAKIKSLRSSGELIDPSKFGFLLVGFFLSCIN
jgi:uncharacterized FlgJ-related protein